MEIKARYVLVGLFSLVVILAGFGFVYWLNTIGGLAERKSYRVQFAGSVSGLLLGSAVQFNGIRVGEVTDLRLSQADPRQVIVTIAINAETPVRADTGVGLAFGGLTGVPEVALSGGAPDAPALQASDGEPPLLVAASTATQDWTQAARDAFSRIDTLLSDNADALKNTLTNLDTFSTALARNSGSVDGIIAGLERLTGASGGGKPAIIYVLNAPTDIKADVLPEGQLMVVQPSAPLAYDTAQFIVQAGGGEEATGFDGARWSDNLPRLLQASVIRSFENAGYPRIGSDMQGLTADHSLLIDIRAFRISTSPSLTAEIDLTAKVLDSFGALVASERFQASAPAAALDAKAAASALNAAFAKAAAALVPWTLATI